MARKEKPTFITEMEPFPQRLKTLLEERGVTQTELASFIGCTRQAISLYVTGQSTPDINILSKISNYFHVSADYLLGLTDTPTTDTTVKSVCGYTGLSEKSVSALHEGTITKLNFINALISNDTLVDIYQTYIDSRDRCSIIQEDYPHIDLSLLEEDNWEMLANLDMGDLIDKGHSIYFYEVNTIQPLALYKLQQEFLQFIKEYTLSNANSFTRAEYVFHDKDISRKLAEAKLLVSFRQKLMRYDVNNKKMCKSTTLTPDNNLTPKQEKNEVKTNGKCNKEG